MEIDKSLVNNYVKAIGNGDKEALSNLYIMIYKPLYYILMKDYSNQQEIEDIILETFDVIVDKSNHLIFYTNCYAWIIKIARNILKNHLRKISKREKLLKVMPIECYVKFNESKSILYMTIQGLSQLDKYLLFYKYYCGFTNNDISKILGISLSNVKRKLKSILEFLKEELKDD